MKLYLKALAISLVLVGVAIMGWLKWQAGTEVERPQHQLIEKMEESGAIDFTATDIDGKAFSLASQKGSVVIVNFWASWCGPCVEEVPSLIKLVEALGGKVKVVAVSGDSDRADIDIFLKSFPKFKSDYITIVWDRDGELSQKYGVDRLPESFILGKDLKLIKKIIGSIGWYSKDSLEYMGELYKK